MVVPIIYQWVIMAAESIFWVLVMKPKAANPACHHHFMVIDGVKLSLPVCSEDEDIQGGDVVTWLHVHRQ